MPITAPPIHDIPSYAVIGRDKKRRSLVCNHLAPLTLSLVEAFMFEIDYNTDTVTIYWHDGNTTTEPIVVNARTTFNAYYPTRCFEYNMSNHKR